jgi:predicted N-acetyltransferase YhbS
MSVGLTAALVRPMADTDVPQAAEVSAEAFEIDISAPSTRRFWERRLRHSLRSDPGGSFVTVRDGRVTGVAQAVIRDGVWILSLLTVSPTLGEGGEGRGLVQATLDYYGECRGGIIIASNDPRALRLYGSSGFALEPTFKASGSVDTTRMPTLSPQIVEIGPAQVDVLAPISRAVRGAAHTHDLAVALTRNASVFALAGSGFVVTMPGRGIWALAARDEEAARMLLWFGLAQLRDEPRVEVGWITARQQWAIDVILDARLSLTAYGAIATRGSLGPMHPYIPSPPFA